MTVKEVTLRTVISRQLLADWQNLQSDQRSKSVHQAWCRCIYVVYFVVCVLNLFEFKCCVPRIILLNIRAICGLPDSCEDYQIFQPGSPADYHIFGVISTPESTHQPQGRVLNWHCLLDN